MTQIFEQRVQGWEIHLRGLPGPLTYGWALHWLALSRHFELALTAFLCLLFIWVYFPYLSRHQGSLLPEIFVS